MGGEYEKSAYDITIVSAGGFESPNSRDVTVTVAAPPETFTLDIAAYEDADADGTMGPAEAGIGGVQVRIYAYATAQSESVYTGPDGTAMADLEPGRILAQVVMPPGYVRATSPVLDYGGGEVPGAVMVHAEPGSTIAMRIGLVPIR